MVGFIEAIKSFYSQYANFSGRATRAEYWWVMLYLFILVGIPSWIDTIQMIAGDGEPNKVLGFWTWIVSLANAVPSLAICWRRLHDIGKGGGWFFISWIPFIGSIWFLVLMLTPSEPYENRFGYPVDDNYLN